MINFLFSILKRLRAYKYVIQYWLPKIRLSWAHSAITGKQYREGYELLRPGYIILSTDSKRLSTVLTPGVWAHAALCVSKGGDYEVAEMTAKGFTKSDFYDICHTSDRVVLLDCFDWDDEYIHHVIKQCAKLDDVEYDDDFQLDNAALYCSELIYFCDTEQRLGLQLRDILGTMYVLPDDIYHATNINIIWDSGVV